MFGLGTTELLVILVVAVLLFGRRIPEVMGGLGKGIRSFKKGMQEDDDKPDSPSKDSKKIDAP